MIYNKFIICSTKAIFDSKLGDGEITAQHIVFIEDVKQLWTNNVFYAANELDPSDLEKVNKLVDIIKLDGSGDKVLTDKGTYVGFTGNIPEENVTILNEIAGIFTSDGDGTKVLADNGTYVANHQFTNTEASKLKTVATVFKNDGSANKVLAENGTYVDKGSFSSEIESKLEDISNLIKTDGDGTKVLADNGTYVANHQFTNTEASKLKTVASTFKNNGTGDNVLTDKGTYVANHQFSTTEARQLKSVATVYKDTGTGTKVLADNGQYVDKGQFSSDVEGKLETISSVIKTDGNGTKVLADNGKYVEVVAKYVERDRGTLSVTSLTNLPVTKSLILATLSGSSDISVSSGMNPGESITVICTPTAAFTQPIPATGNYMSMDGSTLNVKNGKAFELNIYCYAANKYSISLKSQK